MSQLVISKILMSTSVPERSPILGKRDTMIARWPRTVFECYIGAATAELHRIFGKTRKADVIGKLAVAVEMAFYELCIVLFNFIPNLALLIVGSGQHPA
jgi:hypothetical protein